MPLDCLNTKLEPQGCDLYLVRSQALAIGQRRQRDAMAELTYGDRRQALEVRESMPYVMQFTAHEMVYEYNRVVVRLFEGR